MPDRSRFLPQATDEGLARAAREMVVPWSRLSAPLRVTLPAAGVTCDVAHGLGVAPAGYLIVWADGPLAATPGVEWSETLAHLTPTNANTHAIVIFYLLTQEPVHAT